MPSNSHKTTIASDFPDLASADAKVRARAFAELVKTTTSRHLNYLRVRHSVLSDHLLREIVGDAFRALWIKIETGDGEWIEKWSWDYFHGILKFRAINEYKKRRKAVDRFGEHQSKKVTTTDDLEIYGATHPRLAEREMQSNELSAVEAVIAKLPLQQRRVAEILRDNRDAKVGPKEVIDLYHKAHGVTLTPASAKSSMAVVRAKLRAALEQLPVD